MRTTVAIWGCTLLLFACPTTQPASDAGVDGGEIDSSVDIDAGVDAGASAPDGSVLIDDATFARLVDAGVSRADTAEQRAADELVATQIDQQNRADVAAYLSAHSAQSDAVAWGQLLALMPDAADPDVRPAGDGYAVTVLDGGLQLQMLGPTAGYAGAAAAIRALTSRPAQEAVYLGAVSRLNDAELSALGAPTRPAVGTLSDAALVAAIELIAQQANDLHVRFALHPAVVPALNDCSGDFGRGKLLDHYGFADRTKVDLFSTPRQGGIVANYDFPLRESLTCVKNQGARGVCWSFASTSMLESAEWLTHQTRVNYSEQDLVNAVKLLWSPSAYGEGGGAAVFDMQRHHYRPVYENAWAFNPSPLRQGHDDTLSYTSSCLGYDEDCSDTAHQGRRLCNSKGQCMFVSHDNPSTTHAPTSVTWLFDPSSSGKTTNLMMIAVSQGQNVGAGFSVYPPFMNSTDGFVRYSPAAPQGKYYGDHDVHVVGFISTDELTQLLPSAPTPLGGGYFIVKNSWGVTAGDAGYYYVPVAYFWRYLKFAYVLSSIE